MTSYGISAITDVDGNFKSMSMQRKGRASFSEKIAQLATANEDVVVISGVNGDLVQIKKNQNDIVLYSPNATYVDYIIFNSSTTKTQGYGIEVFNEDGSVVFSSNHKFLRPIKLIETHNDRGNFVEHTPKGKHYGVILSNYGFKLMITPDYARRVLRSVNVSDGGVAFNVVNYDMEGSGRTSASFSDESFFAKAILVDVTGY